MVTKRAPDKSQVRVFVYGTLKEKRGNNHLLRCAGAKLLGYDYVVLKNGAFIDLGGFPAAIRSIDHSEGVQKVCGEIWYGNQEMMHSLDILEGHPRFFRRDKYRTELRQRKVWMYTLPEKWIAEGEDFLDPGLWRPKPKELTYWRRMNSMKKLNMDKGLKTMVGE
jgi:gamma-glutamylcyclotransferase (GGCT)/AIG2-like uncharacterized protein YtfP